MSYKAALLIVILSFSVIHMLEVASFLARISGVVVKSTTFGYALQNAVFMCTRFFLMLLLPILGYVVDVQVAKWEFLVAVHLSLFGAVFLGGLSIIYREEIIGRFANIILSVRDGKSLMVELMKFPFRASKLGRTEVQVKKISFYLSGNKIFVYSAIIFLIYALSTFIAFYFGLVFPDYRTTLSQLSGVTNAFATVLLTFYVEPKISLAIDRDGNAADNIMALLLGRLVGVGILAHFAVAPLWLLS